LQPEGPTPRPFARTTPISTSKPVPTKPAKPHKTKAKDNDTGASILNILAFLDADEAGDEDDEDADNGRVPYDQHPSEVEALAGERVIKRLRREEWVGERPVVSNRHVGEQKEKIRANEVDERVVEKVVGGLPDWGFMLE